MNRYFGYIEGYYGKMLSWDERYALCDCMKRLFLNTYVYAPKEDPWHRKDWKIPYPSSWMRAFRSFITYAMRRNVHVVPAVSPGLSFDYTSAADYRILLRKMSAFTDIGGRTVALLMDDIPDSLPRQYKKSFLSLGEAHGKLLSRLQADLRKRRPQCTLWFCPTVYADQLSKKKVSDSTYLNDLAVSMPGDVFVLWTGPAIISENLTRKNIAPVSAIFSGNIIIWDNLYANDYCPQRLFVGPYLGRSRDLCAVVKGLLINPTGLPHTDMFLLSLLSSFTKKVSCAASWKKAIDELSFSREFKTVSRFFQSPFARLTGGEYAVTKIKRYLKALRRLIWDWKSPLQREWYPFLYMLDTDLRLLDSPACRTRSWIAKKYTPVISRILSEKFVFNKKD